MHGIYLASVYLHILAAVTWIGGMLFLVLVGVPWLRRGDRAQAAAFFRQTGPRFRDVGWMCFGVLALTGAFNLWARGVRVEDFWRADWRSSPFGRAVVLKLLAFLGVLMVSALHDFVVGPRAVLAGEHSENRAQTERLRRWASLLGRANVVLALLLVGLAVVIVRGWPG